MAKSGMYLNGRELRVDELDKLTDTQRQIVKLETNQKKFYIRKNQIQVNELISIMKLKNNMKEIDRIKKLTEDAQKAKAEAEEKARLEKLEQERKNREWMVRNAKDVSPLLRGIETAAKRGENKYSIDLGQSNNEYIKLQVKYIKELLSDFNPTFTDEERTRCSYDYDGNSIDGTKELYYATRVHFKW